MLTGKCRRVLGPRSLVLSTRKHLLALVCCLLLSFPGSAQSSVESTELTLVSWNIQMLPNFFSPFSGYLRKKQHVRWPWIVEHCLESDYDVIVFQEVFDIDIRRKLKKHLRTAYPYQVHTKTKFGRFTSNGVLILSRYPMEYIDHVIFERGVSEDGLAAKGCTLVEVVKDGIRVQIVGTHLQSGGSEKEALVRIDQYQEIRALLDRNRKEEVAVFCSRRFKYTNGRRSLL